MTTNEVRQHEMLRRVAEFGRVHRDRFRNSPRATQAFEQVTAAAEAIAELSMVPGGRAGGQMKATTRSALARELENIARCARVVERDHPELADIFRVPRPRSDARLVFAGRVFASRAEPVKADFIALGASEDFVTRLVELVDEFERANRGRAERKTNNVAARTALHRARVSGLTAVRILDLIVGMMLRDDPGLLAVWKSTRRVEYLRRARKRTPRRRIETVDGRQ